jgi:hypothetical protein
MKPIASKRFYCTIDNQFYWSKAHQSLTLSARNLMLCFYTELRWTGKGKKRQFTNNGNVSFTEAEFKFNRLGCSATYIKARNQLIKVGFIKVTHRGGMGKGVRNLYKLLWCGGALHSEMRWKRYPDENWKHEIPRPKKQMVGVESQWKKGECGRKSKPTLQKHTLNGTNPPTKVYPINANPPTKIGRNL